MDYSKLIYDYLEGELDIAEEQKLFSEMAYNDSLREEFGEELKLSSVFAEDNFYQTTPIEATDKVFTQLGFSIPTASGKSYAYSFWDKIGKSSVVILLLLLGAASTAGIMYFSGSGIFNNNSEIAADSESSLPVDNNYINASGDNYNSENISGLNSSDLNSFFTDIYNSLSKSVNFASDSFNGSITGNSDSKGDKLKVLQRGSNSELNIGSNNSDIKTNKIKTVRNSNFSKFYSGISSFSAISSPNMVFIPVSGNMFGSIIKDNRFSLESKGSLNNYYPAINNVNIDAINSFEIAFRYNINEKNAFGVIFGRNNFAQKFNTDDGLAYYQAPELFWFGASYKRFWLEDELYGIFMPYSQIMAGATTIGPVFKLESGIEVPLYGNFKIMLGAESNSLIYNVDGNIYNSNNIGIIYGVKYSF